MYLMNFEMSAQLCYTSDPELYNWAMKNTKDSNFNSCFYKMYKESIINPHSKYYHPHSLIQDDQEDFQPCIGSYAKKQFLMEIGQVREDIVRFKSEMNGLAKQMTGIEAYLNHSKDRVYEIEERLAATQEVNVNLQVLLEKAVDKQKESDVYATREMRHIHTNLATIVYETGRLKVRLTTIAKYQKQHQGNVNDVVKRMKEYTYMLEQAQGIIQDLNKSHTNKPHHYQKPSTITKSDLYKYRIIRKKAPETSCASSWLPQKGLRILLNDFHGY